MNSQTVLAVLFVVAVIAVVVLLVRCTLLQSRMNRTTQDYEQIQSQLEIGARDLQHAQAQLTTSMHAFQELQMQFNNRVQHMFSTWREREIDMVREQLSKAIFEQARTAFKSWQTETEANIRADAIKRSSAVVSGKVVEHLVPYFGVFPYNPQDARFLGAPVDIVVFDGLSEGELRQIIFIEVKTNTSTLSTRERRVRDVIQARNVTWQELRIGT
jgi:predicted Holliday junction resolvase-like endonuclease